MDADGRGRKAGPVDWHLTVRRARASRCGRLPSHIRLRRGCRLWIVLRRRRSKLAAGRVVLGRWRVKRRRRRVVLACWRAELGRRRIELPTGWHGKGTGLVGRRRCRSPSKGQRGGWPYTARSTAGTPMRRRLQQARKIARSTGGGASRRQVLHRHHTGCANRLEHPREFASLLRGRRCDRMRDRVDGCRGVVYQRGLEHARKLTVVLLGWRRCCGKHWRYRRRREDRLWG